MEALLELFSSSIQLGFNNLIQFNVAIVDFCVQIAGGLLSISANNLVTSIHSSFSLQDLIPHFYFNFHSIFIVATVLSVWRVFWKRSIEQELKREMKEKLRCSVTHCM